jgi:hypothetical protein
MARRSSNDDADSEVQDHPKWNKFNDEDSDDSSTKEADVELIPFDSEEPDFIYD